MNQQRGGQYNQQYNQQQGPPPQYGAQPPNQQFHGPPGPQQRGRGDNQRRGPNRTPSHTVKQLFDVYVTGFDSARTNEELRLEFENISGIPCVRLTNKGQYLFYQVEGEENYRLAREKLNGAKTSFGNTLASYSSKRKQDNSVRDKKLAKILQDLAPKYNISPPLDLGTWYLLEKSMRSVHISNLQSSVTEQDIIQAFQDYGPVENVNIIQKMGYSTGYAFVTYVAHEHHQSFRQINAKSMFIGNSSVRVNHSKPGKQILEHGRLAGLLDNDGQPTALWFQILEPALQTFSQMYPQLVLSAMAGLKTKDTNLCYMQDPNTGQIYAMTPEQYQQQLNLLQQNGMYQQQQQQQQPPPNQQQQQQNFPPQQQPPGQNPYPQQPGPPGPPQGPPPQNQNSQSQPRGPGPQSHENNQSNFQPRPPPNRNGYQPPRPGYGPNQSPQNRNGYAPYNNGGYNQSRGRGRGGFNQSRGRGRGGFNQSRGRGRGRGRGS